MNDSQTPSTESIGDRLRRLRLERKLSQRDLSAPGVSYAYISRIEAGTRQPSVKAVRKLAAKLGVSPEYLETGSELRDVDERELRLANAELNLRLAENTEEAEEELDAIRAEALGAGDLRSAVRALTGLGLARFHAGSFRETIALLEEAVELGDISPVERPDVFTTLARAQAAVGRTRGAVDLLESCLSRVEDEASEDVTTQIRFATTLSHALVDLGDLPRAHRIVADALERAGTDADSYTRIRLYWSLARVSRLQGNPTRALTYARRAISLLETTEDTLHLARAHLLAGSLLVTQGDGARALESLERAERLFGPDAEPLDRAYVRTEQARAAVLLSRGDEAVSRAREALDVLGDSDPAERGSATLALAQGLALGRDFEAAARSFEEADSMLEQAGRHQERAQAYRWWGRALRDAGRESEALDALDKAADLAVRSAPAETHGRA